jgi:tRNA threonylcarbamoyladenosine biosynthesis protein TsaB
LKLPAKGNEKLFMTILALEFSSARRSVALARGATVLAEAIEQTDARGTHAFGLIEKVLADGNTSREQIEAIAIGLGPGSYTGIRAAIAVAQGWQLARAVKLLGVSSAAAIAARAQAEKILGCVSVLIDAQRGGFYRAAWQISETARTEVLPLKIIPGGEAAALATAGEICVGPEQARKIFPTAADVARLAAGRTDFISGETMEPIYLRETNFVKTPAGKILPNG